MSETVLKFQGEPLTRREIELARYADARARCAALWSANPSCSSAHRAYDVYSDGCSLCREKAASRWPLPKVTRPRVVADSSGERWAVRAGTIVLYDSDVTPFARPTAERVKLWAYLLDNPTETVEADE